MVAATLSAKAQEVTINLSPGWNWISYPNATAMEVGEALEGLVPMEGDMIKSQYSFSTYHNGYWLGGLTHFMPGKGYVYYSSRSELTSFVFAQPSSSFVATATPTDITATSAVVGGTVTIDEGNHIFARGVCWGTEPNPNIDGSHTTDAAVTGSLSDTLTELTSNTTYYVRAYAVTDYGLAYGEELSFVTESGIPMGAINGAFSVSENNQVYFSQGNLQYQASTNTWRFAENQWDYVGEGNANASATYEGWIDLFGWGTSGYNHGAKCYQPWSTSENNDDYHVYGSSLSSLYDHNGQADWGYNPISNGGNTSNQWHTLTQFEWNYVFNTRTTTSGIRYAKAKVNNVYGVILLPDDWNSNTYSLSNTNSSDASFSSNTITNAQWTILEDAGAVFLPVGGFQYGTSFYYVDYYGCYWSALCNSVDYAYCVTFNDWYLDINSDNRCCNRSVRLVRPAQANTSYTIEAAPNPAQGGTITGVGTYNYYDQVTLTANASEGYTLYQWKENGNVISTESPYTFVALFDRSLEAVFLESSTYPLLYSFNEDDHTATVIGHWDGVELEGELVIPETVMHNGETYTVTAIGEYAFHDCSGLTGSLVIPNTVTFIDHNAFNSCTGLTSVIIPNSVTSMGAAAFCWCSGLTSVTISNLVTSIGDWTFIGCNNLTSVVIPNSVTNIGYEAFFACSNLTSVEFPSSLESISDFAFGECNGITDVFIPSSVTQIGKNPFTKCSNLSQITVESSNTYYDSRDDSHAIIETATNKLVSGSLTSIVPNTVTSMGEEAFWGISVPSITIPESVNYIGANAIRIYTLSSMTVLAEVPPTLGYCAFCDTDHSIPVYVPCGSIEAYQNAEGWNEFTNFIGVGQCSGMVTVTASPAEYGTVSGGGFYEGSATCTVTATPNEGYYFLCWMEDGQWVSSEANYTFPVYRDHNLTAVFYATLGDEMVVNGDFEQGNVGFTSGYEYNLNNNGGHGSYYVGSETIFGDIYSFGHGGTGNFMIMDGATEPGVIIWTEQISVAPNTYYVFSTWVCTLYPESMALLQFSINGTQIGDVFRAPSQTNTWEQFNTLWYSGNSTTATITILDQNTEGGGNDFGLDDISFREMDPVQGGIPTGAINGKFTINADGDQVYFSQGNLQYQASTNTWKFADNQYDYVGSDNSNISSTLYDGWIDLFGWGTSGWNSGNVYYFPWNWPNSDGSLYGPPGSYNLVGSYAHADWGVHNAINNGGNQTNQWRTLTQSEWDYVFSTRSTASGIRYAKANVNNVNGVILLPDDWSTSTYIMNNTNDRFASFSCNTLTALQWSTLEQAGAVFLPAAGYRNGTSISSIDSSGGYWSATNYSSYNSYDAYGVYFNDSNIYTYGSNGRGYGHSVRLVRVAEN